MAAGNPSQLSSAPYSQLWLRSATAADAPLLLHLIQAAFEEYRDRLAPPSGAHAETAAKLSATLVREQAVLAGLGAAPAGCVFYDVKPDETYLHRLAVLPAYRGLGVGRALVAHVEACARAAGSPQVRLSVRLQLPVNQAFYAGLGYTVAGYGTHSGFAAPTFVNLVKDLTAPPVRAVTVVPPDPAWAVQFRAEAALLQLVFGDELVAIHHIGSTAIPGMCAKPILDLLPVVRDLQRVDSFDPLLVALGYAPRGEYGVPGRRYFVKGAATRHTHHVHVFAVGNPEIVRHLHFRDYLTACPARAQAYGELKVALATAYPADIDSYVAGKDGLIRTLNGEAQAWSLQTGVPSGQPVEIDTLVPADWPQVRAIYLEGIATGDATFEQTVPSWEAWDNGRLPSCRLVARRGEEVLGWAALSPVSTRAAYAGVAEVSVYVGERRRGQGIGRLLLRALIVGAEAAGIWTLQAGIFPENRASTALHQACGFRIVGQRERIGKLNGRWRDVLLLERRSAVAGQRMGLRSSGGPK